MSRLKKYTSSNPQELARELRSNAELRRVYNRRMDAVQRQVERIEKRFGPEAVTSTAQELPQRSRNLSQQEMLNGISAANRYLKSESSTVRGYSESLRKEKQSLADYGIDIPLKDLPKVNNFLDQLRADGYGSLLPSDQIISAAKRAAKRGFNYAQLKGNIEYFAANPGARNLKASRYSSSEDF